MIQIIRCRNGKCIEILKEGKFEIIAHEINGKLILNEEER